MCGLLAGGGGGAGGEGYVGPPSQIIGGPGLPSSYAYVIGGGGYFFTEGEVLNLTPYPPPPPHAHTQSKYKKF